MFNSSPRIRRIGLGAAAALFALALAGCSGRAKEPGSPAVATVGEKPITIAQYQRKLKFLRLGFSNLSAGESTDEDARMELLSQMVQEEMCVQEAGRLGLTVDAAEAAGRFKKVESEYGGGFARALAQEGLTVEDYKADIGRKLLVEKLTDREVYSKVKVPREKALRYFNEHRSEFSRKESVRARQIVVDSEADAKAVLAQLKKGADFAALAKAKSLSPDRDKGGDLGWFAKGEMPPQFDRVFGMKPGETSGVVRTPYGWHIFRLEERRKGGEPNFGEAMPEVVKTLAAIEGEEAFRKWQDEMAARIPVEVSFDRLGQL